MNNFEDKKEEKEYLIDPLDKYLPTKEDWDTYYEWKNNCEDRKK